MPLSADTAPSWHVRCGKSGTNCHGQASDRLGAPPGPPARGHDDFRSTEGPSLARSVV